MKLIAWSSDGTLGHTGRGADFQLATLNYKNYGNLYVMTEIPEEVKFFALYWFNRLR